MVLLEVNFGSVLGICWAMWRLGWAFVGPFNSLYPETVADRANFQAHVGLCWRLLGLKFNPNGSMGPLGFNFGSVSGLCSYCLEYKANLATRFGLATRMQEKNLIEEVLYFFTCESG